MRQTDIAIVGGGLAGSIAAAMLSRQGFGVSVVDPHKVFPPDFRCEKFGDLHIDLLRKVGLLEPVLAAATPCKGEWIARFGRLVEVRPIVQYGMDYGLLVNTIRGAAPPSVDAVIGKVTGIATSDDRQTVTLAGGEQISARLVIVANGLNSGLRDAIGMAREELSPCHSISIGFDIEPAGQPRFAFPMLTYFSEVPSDRTAYLTLFPIGGRMRANLFVYRELSDPCLKKFKTAPREALFEMLPKLKAMIGDIAVTGQIRIRPIDLYETQGVRKAGIVLVGDASSTACPAAGTGIQKVFIDVDRLCSLHVPRWMATSGMDADKIAAYYDDPEKIACDRQSRAKAFNARSLAIEPGLIWGAKRWVRFLGGWGVGAVRAVGA